MVTSTYNDKKDLRKGEKLMICIEDVLHDTLMVVLEHRGMKFCGVLLNTSKRRGPYGIEPEINGVKLNEMKCEEPATTVKRVSFPEPLETRLSYNQDVEQPPVRNFFKRKRRSKRKVKMDMCSDEYSRCRKLLSHNPTCHCDICEAAQPCVLAKDNTSRRKSTIPIKDTSSNSIPIKEEIKDVVETKRAKTEIIDANVDGMVVRRSPVIKISFKSPGGKGQVLKIPSKIHLSDPSHPKIMSPISNKKLSKMHQSFGTPQARAKRVLNKAKYDRYRYLTKSAKKRKATSPKVNPVTKEAKVVLKQLNKTDAFYRQNVSEAVSSKKSKDNKNGIYELDSSKSKSGTDSTPEQESKTTPNRARSNNPQTHSLNVTRCKTYKGFTICQGDIVWGKIQGFPWWPGQVKFITCKKVDGDVLQQEACVDWFQSKTVSILQAHTLENFSKFFDKRFEKKRKGVRYKRAIQMAKDAEKQLTPEVRGLISQFET